MLKETITDKRKERHSVTQEDFTPNGIVNDLLSRIPEEAYTDFTKTILDNSCGIGNILCVVLQKRLDNCQAKEDVADALKTIYGVELMADNVEETRERLYVLALEMFPDIADDFMLNFKVRAIIRNRIRWNNSLTCDYNNWPSLSMKPCFKHDTISFKVTKRKGDTTYPMWSEKGSTC